MSDKPNVLRETDDEARRLAARLIRTARFGALAVIERDSGHPFASRVAVATDIDGAPVILVSRLSTHTGALDAEPRCSLLLGEPGKGDPLAHPRITLQCRAMRLERGSAEHGRVRSRYLSRHPKAELYVDFPDFAFFRLEPSMASLNGGFGKAFALEPADVLIVSPATAGLAAMEEGAVAHMNADHREAIDLYAAVFAGAQGAGWRLAGIDAAGIDLARGDELRRVEFEMPLADAGALRTVLKDMAARAREGESQTSSPPANPLA